MQHQGILIRIVDDDDDVRDALSFLLQGEGWPTKSYENAIQFLEQDDLSIPGCLVLDVRMPNSISGLELQEKLISLSIRLPIIFVSAHGDIEMAVHTIQNGAIDFLTKPVSEEKLFSSISRAVELSLKTRRDELRRKAINGNWDTLTPREKRVALLLSQGKQNKVVASELDITVRTVQVYRASIYLKLGVHSAAEITTIMQSIKNA